MNFYAIDENMARTAKHMNSFSDYVPGSATAEYQKAVTEAQAIAERQKSKVSTFYHAKIDSLLDSYSRRYAAWINDENRNAASCPSVLICGPANFPTRKKERQNARERSLMEEYREIAGILDKIKSVGTGPIDFADPHAREMLQERIEQLQRSLDKAKTVNAYYRKNQTLIGCPVLSPESAKRMQSEFEDFRQRYPGMGSKPYADYELQSIRAKLKAAQQRLEQYESLQQSKDDPAAEVDGCQIVKNTELNRLQLIFDGKPDDETRDRLKANGFRWSPRNGAWQRQLTDNAIRAAKAVLEVK